MPKSSGAADEGQHGPIHRTAEIAAHSGCGEQVPENATNQRNRCAATTLRWTARSPLRHRMGTELIRRTPLPRTNAAGAKRPGPQQSLLNSKLKLPSCLCVSSPTACQETVYLPGASSPFTGTINCALSFGLSAAEPTGFAFPAAFFSSIPVKANSTASLNWMRMAFGDAVTTLPG